MKKDNFNFHLENIKELDSDGNYLRTLKGFSCDNPNYFYSRDDKSGWWMVTKQIIIRKYISAYLSILGKQGDIDLYFIDLLSSWGMNRVTKSGGKDVFLFPGTSFSAALISDKKLIGFKEFYVNDMNPEVRRILNQRYISLNNKLTRSIRFNIDLSENSIDSNDWAISVMNDIKNKDNKKKNYLMIIDNEGMNVSFETIKKVRDISEYGDLIIIFQDVAIARQIHNSDRINDFFGIHLDEETKQTELCRIYTSQLKKIGFGRIEPIVIDTTGGYYYTLLFCCRGSSSAEWLRIIEKYRDNRFKSWNDSHNKTMWDIVRQKIKPINSFFTKKNNSNVSINRLVLLK